MKHHKQFRAALRVSIEERRALYSDMDDMDVVKALHIVAGEMQSRATRQRQAQERAESNRIYEEIFSKRPTQKPREATAEERQRDAERQRNSERRLAEIDARRAERDEQRKLSLRMIDIGYKTLAKEPHPDKGGAAETMKRLNRARQHQKSMA
jgi:hypothetical protein